MRPADPPYVNGDAALEYDPEYSEMMARYEVDTREWDQINKLLDEMEAA